MKPLSKANKGQYFGVNSLDLNVYMYIRYKRPSQDRHTLELNGLEHFVVVNKIANKKSPDGPTQSGKL